MKASLQNALNSGNLDVCNSDFSFHSTPGLMFVVCMSISSLEEKEEMR